MNDTHDSDDLPELMQQAGVEDTIGLLSELTIDFDPLVPLEAPLDDGALSGLEDRGLDLGDPIGDLVYGGEQDPAELATDLWHRIGPGGPPPTGDDGSPLSPGELLSELRYHTDDALTRSVIDRSIEQWERQNDDWSEHLGPSAGE